MWRLEIGNKMPIKGSRLVFKKCPELGFRSVGKERDTHTLMQTQREIDSQSGAVGATSSP
jgi:hypothetical protein